MTYQSTVRRLTLVTAILVAIASALFLVGPHSEQGVPLAQASVEGGNTPATGAPTIIGTAQVGETLTADTTGIADEDGKANASFDYQWLADDSEIAGATDLTYTLTDSEESKAITVAGELHRRRR